MQVPALFGFTTCRDMAVARRAKPPLKAAVIKDIESKERRRKHARDSKARNATNLDRHVLQAYKVIFVSFWLV